MHAWAGEWDDPMWQVWGWKTGYANDGWLASSMGPGTDYNIGTITTDEYYLKGLSAQTKNDASVDKVHCYITYPDKTTSDYYIAYSSNWDSGKKKYWESKGVWGGGYHIVNTQDPGDYTIDLYFKMKNTGDEYAENHRKITWTIPGFKTDDPTSFSFGSKCPVNVESVAKIGVVHYGTEPIVGNCELSGTNASEFEVIDINYSGVTVMFKPTSAGAKSATLTITDAYSKTWTVDLTGTGAANTATTRLYFNDYTNHSDWANDGALYRFTFEYTSGIYTRYEMTQIGTYNYYADVELKSATPSIDRYNPSSPHEAWNWCYPAISASNPYAISKQAYDVYVTDHPFNDVTGGKFYYDNSKSEFENTLYLAIGRDNRISDDADDEYSKAYSLTEIENTQLSYISISDEWHDATYYAVFGASSAPSGNGWGSNDLSGNADGSGYTAAYEEPYGLFSGSTYLALANSKTNGAMNISSSPTLTNTQTFNYALSTDGGTGYTVMKSGNPNTPGQLSMSAFEFTDATYTAVRSKSAQTLSANATTYSKAVSSVAYTGTTELEESNTRDGYTFMGWYEGNTQLTNASTHSYTYYPRTNQTLTARYKAHRYTIAFSNNDAQYSSAPAATGSTTGISNVVYDQNVTLTANGFNRTGYTFAGWSTTADGDVAYSNGQSVSNLTDEDGATVTLYAQWTETTHTVGVAYKYGETSIHDAGSVAGVGIVTTQNAEAIAITGYDFTTWSAMPDGVTTSNELDETTITINATADSKTITANYTPKEYSGTIDKTSGTADGSYTVTFKTTSLSASDPTKAGYHVSGYYLDNEFEHKIADDEGALRPSVTYSSDYTNESSEWIYDGNPKLYVTWAANTITITLHRNDGSSTSTTTAVTMGGTDYTPAPSELTRAGYTFNGYYTAPTGGVQVFKKNGATNDEATDYIGSYSSWIWPEDVDLYAQWTPVALSFVGGEGESGKVWGTAANWSPACVPTSSHNVTINAETKITGSAVADTVTIAEGGKVIIEATGVLEVGSTVINTNSDKLVINTTTSSQGALIFDITKTSPSATVNMTLNGSGFHLIASPTGGAKVSSTFAGSGIYTYAWEEGKGWDRRGYYDDFTGNEAILIYGQTTCNFSGILSKACGGSLRYTAEPADASAQGINMLANPLTAPIKINELSFSGSADDGVHILENGSWRSYAPASSQAASAVIPALQGYGVIAESSGSVSFNYTNAVRNASSHNDALRAPKRATEDTPDYMTISVLTGERKIDLQLSEHAQFSERIDKGWEAIYIEGDGRFGELYALADKKMNILATPDLEGTVLGFVPGQAASYTISFEGDGKGYYLNDLDEQESTLIEEGNTYVFTPNESSNATRFVISKMPIQKTTTGNDAIYDGSKARKQMIDGILYIIRDGRMYDATGVLVK